MTPKQALEILLQRRSQQEVSDALAAKGLSFGQPAISKSLKEDRDMSWEVGNALIELARAEKRRKRK